MPVLNDATTPVVAFKALRCSLPSGRSSTRRVACGEPLTAKLRRALRRLGQSRPEIEESDHVADEFPLHTE